MDIGSTIAARSYAQALTAAAPAPQPGAPAKGLMGAIGSFADTLAQGEATARAAMTGGASPQALVEALAASQTAIETVATVRDRVVEAYQEILRMPV